MRSRTKKKLKLPATLQQEGGATKKQVKNRKTAFLTGEDPNGKVGAKVSHRKPKQLFLQLPKERGEEE